MVAALAAAARADEFGTAFHEAWRWVRFGPQSGIPQVRTFDLAEAETGEVCAATAWGLSFYDGYRWTAEEPAAGLAAGVALRAVARPGGGFVVVAGRRLHVGRRGAFRVLPLRLSGAPAEATDAVPLDTRRIAVIARLGEFEPLELRVLEDDGRPAAAPAPPDPGAFGRLFRTEAGRVWLAARDGLYAWEGERWVRRIEGAPGEFRAMTVAEEPDGTTLVSVVSPAASRALWAVRPDGVSLRVGEHAPRALAIDGRGRAIAAFDSGDVRLRVDGAWRDLHPVPPELRNVVTLSFRRSGDLWAATEVGVALLRTSASRWTRWRRGFGDPWDSVNEIVARRDGSLALGTQAGVEIRRPDGTVERFDRSDGVPLSAVTGLAEDADGALWASSGSEFTGAYRYDGATWRRYGPEDGLRAGHIHRIACDRRGRPWFLGLTRPPPDASSDGPGAFVLDGGEFRRWSVEEGVPDGRVYAFTEGPDGALWFGTRHGLARWKDGAWRSWTSADGLPHAKVFALACDGAGRPWFALQDRGLGRLDERGRVVLVTAAEGLPSDSVWDVRADAHGDIWASTWGGIWVRRGDAWGVLGPAAGLDVARAWPILPLEGRVVVGTLGGGTYVLDLAEQQGPPPRVHVDEPVVDGSRALVRWTPAAWWGSVPADQVRTRWRLDGGDWSTFTPARDVVLAGLPPGVHRVEVQAQDLYGRPSPPSPAIEFTVLAPLVRRPEFWVPVGGLAAAVVGLGVLLRLRRLRYRADLDRAEGRLREAQRLESVGRLAGGVAHDFNTLLTVITGFAHLARARVGGDATAAGHVEQVIRAADRAAVLTRDLLAFGRRQTAIVTLLDLNEPVRGTLPMVTSLVGAHVEVDLRLDPSLPPVLVDPNQVAQIVLNLAANARDAMPGGGRLTIETRHERVERRRFRDDGPAPGRWVVLSVRDTGTGMDEATRARALEPFFTTKGIGKGTGLGLSSVYGIAKQHGGDVEVESALGQGTTVRVRLPASAERAPASPAAALS